MTRLRLSLGEKQVDALLGALAWAIDSYAGFDDDTELRRIENDAIRRWEAVRETIRRERVRQKVSA